MGLQGYSINSLGSYFYISPPPLKNPKNAPAKCSTLQFIISKISIMYKHQLVNYKKVIITSQSL